MKLLFILLLSTSSILKAQNQEIKEEVIFISPFYELQFPFGDMKKDYGVNSNLGLDISLINNSNLYFGLNSSFLFAGSKRHNYSEPFDGRQ